VSRRQRPNVMLPEDAVPITVSESNYRRARHIDEDEPALDGESPDAQRFETYLRRAAASTAAVVSIGLLLAAFVASLLGEGPA
jgi:Flp pilus assembly CpaF family ATPase